MSIAKTLKSSQVNVGGVSHSAAAVSDWARYLLPPNWVRRYESLSSDENDWEELDEDESYVKVGDPVVLVALKKARRSRAQELWLDIHSE